MVADEGLLEATSGRLRVEAGSALPGQHALAAHGGSPKAEAREVNTCRSGPSIFTRSVPVFDLPPRSTVTFIQCPDQTTSCVENGEMRPPDRR
jgi:hypothetical protein